MPVAFVVTITVAPGSASPLLVLVAPQTVAEVSYAYMLAYTLISLSLDTTVHAYIVVLA